MMIRKTATALSLALLFPASAMASDWAYVGDNPSMSYYVDLSTISIKNGIKRVWMNYIYDKPQVDTYALGKRFDSSKVKLEINCSTKEMRSLEEHNYLGNDIGGEATKPSNWIDPIPDSVGQYTVMTLCTRAAQVPKWRIANVNSDPAQYHLALRAYQQQQRENAAKAEAVDANATPAQ